VACAILHNIAKRSVALRPADDVGQPQPEDQATIPLHNRGAAQAARQAFNSKHFIRNT